MTSDDVTAAIDALEAFWQNPTDATGGAVKAALRKTWPTWIEMRGTRYRWCDSKWYVGIMTEPVPVD